MAFESGREKTGGRQKGSKNKSTMAFRAFLEEENFCIPKEAVRLYKKIPDNVEGMWYDKKIELLKFIAAFSYSKPKDTDIEEAEYQPNPYKDKTSDELLAMIHTEPKTYGASQG